MDYFTSRNLVILALVQIGILVGDVLGAGAALKWYTELPSRAPVPLPCRLLAELGWLGLVLPIIWLTLALLSLLRENTSEKVRVTAVIAGGFLGVLFLLRGLIGAVRPWLQLIGRFDSF